MDTFRFSITISCGASRCKSNSFEWWRKPSTRGEDITYALFGGSVGGSVWRKCFAEVFYELSAEVFDELSAEAFHIMLLRIQHSYDAIR